VRNFRYGRLEDYEGLSPENLEKMRVKNTGCYNCAARCGKVHVVKYGPYAGAESEGPEYESCWSFTGPVDQTCIEATVAADQLCDDLGLDTISTGGVIGFAFELYEKGILTKNDIVGLELVYGNHQAMIALIRKIAMREGIGDLLAEGVLRCSQKVGEGTEYFAMHVKGLEMAGYEPRGLKATGFGYATNTIGGSHNNGALALQELGIPIPRALDRLAEDGKADIVIYNQNQAALRKVGIVCAFAVSWGDWYKRLFNQMLVAATGIKEFEDWDYLHQVSERIWNLDRAFNNREGFDRKYDTLPPRIMVEPLHTKGGPGEGEIIKGLERFLDEYYKLEVGLKTVSQVHKSS